MEEFLAERKESTISTVLFLNRLIADLDIAR
jgi:hypothetical protein